jgi:dipeptidyl aminopeptidase/acylaminoacyl peptidase
VQLPTGPAGADRVAVSPDGTTVAFTSAQAANRAWVFPFDADRGTPPGEGRAVTDEDASVEGLQLSADGRSIFYSEVRPGRDPVPGIEMRLDTGQTTVLYAHANSSPVPAPSGGGTAYQLMRPRAKVPNDLEFALAWRSRDGRERLIASWGAGAVHPTDVRRDEQAVLGTWMPRAYTGRAALVEWPIGPSAVAEPRTVLLTGDRLQFWQGRYSPDGRWVSFVVVTNDGRGQLQMGVVPSDTRGGSTWIRLAADHAWPDKPRWSPDGRTIYFVSRSASGYFALRGLRFDPERGVQTGEPFLIKAFDSPRWHIDPNPTPMEIGVAKGTLALPMRSVKGSIWMLSMAGT